MGKFSRLGNDLYSGKKSIDFVGRTAIWYAISGVIIVAAVLGLYFKGLNFGLEFRGGAQFTVTMPSGQATQDNADKLRNDVAGTGIPSAQQVVVSTAGKNNIIVETEPVFVRRDGGLVRAGGMPTRVELFERAGIDVHRLLREAE